MNLKDSRPPEQYFLGILDDEDHDEAALMAAKIASNAMMAQAMANKGMT